MRLLKTKAPSTQPKSYLDIIHGSNSNLENDFDKGSVDVENTTKQTEISKLTKSIKPKNTKPKKLSKSTKTIINDAKEPDKDNLEDLLVSETIDNLISNESDKFEIDSLFENELKEVGLDIKDDREIKKDYEKTDNTSDLVQNVDIDSNDKYSKTLEKPKQINYVTSNSINNDAKSIKNSKFITTKIQKSVKRKTESIKNKILPVERHKINKKKAITSEHEKSLSKVEFKGNKKSAEISHISNLDIDSLVDSCLDLMDQKKTSDKSCTKTNINKCKIPSSSKSGIVNEKNSNKSKTNSQLSQRKVNNDAEKCGAKRNKRKRLMSDDSSVIAESNVLTKFTENVDEMNSLISKRKVNNDPEKCGTKKNKRKRLMSDDSSVISEQKPLTTFTEDGVFVYCDECCKFRQLKYIKKPEELPERWVCEMFQDGKLNCDSPEEDFSHLFEYFINNKFTLGSIVWAKLPGFNWWPGIVDSDPDVDVFYWLFDESDEVSHYHVTFLDKEVSRSWVLVKDIKPFKHRNEYLDKMTKNSKTLSTKLKIAAENAEECLKLSLDDRISKFGFSTRYNGSLNIWTRPSTLGLNFDPNNCGVVFDYGGSFNKTSNRKRIQADKEKSKNIKLSTKFSLKKEPIKNEESLSLEKFASILEVETEELLSQQVQDTSVDNEYSQADEDDKSSEYKKVSDDNSQTNDKPED